MTTGAELRALAPADLLRVLLAQEESLDHDRFDIDDAWRVGSRLKTTAIKRGLGVAIAIDLGEQRAFHAATPGSAAVNDAWLARKFRVVCHYGHASLAVRADCLSTGTMFEADSALDLTRYAAAGGAFPIRVRGSLVGVLGVLDNVGAYGFMIFACVQIAGGLALGAGYGSWAFACVAFGIAALCLIVGLSLRVSRAEQDRRDLARAEGQLAAWVQERDRMIVDAVWGAAADVFITEMTIPIRFRRRVIDAVRNGNLWDSVPAMEQLAPMPKYGDAPTPVADQVTPDAYEDYCAVWMRHKGASGVRVTQRSRDGGIDITSSHFVAQCKRYAGVVPVREIRDLVGAASVQQKHPLFFTTGQFTAPGIRFADEAKVALFQLQTTTGVARPLSNAARWLDKQGLDIVECHDGEPR